MNWNWLIGLEFEDRSFTHSRASLEAELRVIYKQILKGTLSDGDIAVYLTDPKKYVRKFVEDIVREKESLKS